MLGVPKGVLNGAVKSGSGHTPKTPFHLGWRRECQYLREKVSEQRINLVHPQVQPLTIDPSWYEVEQLTTLHAATKLSYQTKPNLQELRTTIGMVHCPGLKLCIRNVHSMNVGSTKGNSERSGKKRWQRTYPQNSISFRVAQRVSISKGESEWAANQPSASSSAALEDRSIVV